jgi:hypothetical protein
MGDRNVTNKQNKETNFLIDRCLCQSQFLHKIATDDFREALCSFKMASNAFLFLFLFFVWITLATAPQP